MNLRKYMYSHCIHPVKVKIWDAYSNGYVVREVPCGRCLHCQNTHINEWVTRLVAQRKYSKYCYYVSLDYAPFDENNKVALQLAAETAACKHDINKWHTYGLHPLVLCKNHLQDFYKRLRKNTQIKMQYFACGEYGMHANGRGYGRPHFHNIIFSNELIPREAFESAWTIDGYKIGRVDFQDMTAYGIGSNNNIKIFKYVCKYLQKTDFDFDKLATIDYHRTYFKSLQYVLERTETLFPEKVPIEDVKTLRFNWCEYIKQYSPFVVCSRRPSIGSAYLVENLERFKKQDFRLFGLPKGITTFPRYYVRRTQEALFDFRCIGSVSKKPTSSARMGHILQVLNFMYNTRYSIDNWSEKSAYSWSVCKYANSTDKVCKGQLCVVLNNNISAAIPCVDLSFYDVSNKFMYQFDGYNYKVWAKLQNHNYALIDTMDIIDVLHECQPSWDRYHKTYLTPKENMRVLREHELINTINALYKATENETSYELFM